MDSPSLYASHGHHRILLDDAVVITTEQVTVRVGFNRGNYYNIV